ncbi:MAG: FlgD immunoglobulin-like domain containing protein [Candidatus Krumholzibacteria bacterium]|jgi:hypothetical protein|nr:FlgD immunoglobulin-like domain containing protein [Candidatus Krumholzibacteria bacterium]
MAFARSVLLVLAIGLAAPCRGNVLPVTWSDQFHSTGPNGIARCLVRWQGDVVLAGRFNAVGSVVTLSQVARVRDGVWEPLGDIAFGSDVMALVVHDGGLYAIVKEGATSRVVRFDNGQWIDVGDPLPTSSAAIASYQGDLYVGSYRLEGDHWVDRLQTDNAVRSLVVMDDLLVAGGEFTSGAGAPTGHVLAWDGLSVLAAFAGQDSTVADLAVWNDQLYAARSTGYYLSVPAVQVWQEGAWVDIPELGMSNPSRRVTDLEAGDGRLLVCGYWIGFLVKEDLQPDPDRSYFGAFAMSWNGTSAEILNSVGGYVEYWKILEDGGDVLVAGDFATVGQPNCANLGRAVNGVMTPVCEPGQGASDVVSVLSSSGDALVAGGSFASIGGLFSRNVAVYQAGAWSARDLGNGVEFGEYNSLRSVGWHAGNLYVVAGGHTGGGAGYWSDGQWHMTEQTWSYPSCDELLSWSGMLLGDGGWGGVLRFASLANPTTYASVDRRIIDIATVGTDLVVGGDFSLIAGEAAANAAIYAGGAWQPLGGGLLEQVRVVGSWQGQAVAVTLRDSGNVVYLLVGDHWEEIGTLTGGLVSSVMEFDGLLFVGGSFDSPADDGTPMVGLACWTGSRWRSVGEIRNVACMAVHDQRLWLGGAFHFAGGEPAWHLTSLTVDDVTGVAQDDVASAGSLRVSPAPNPFNPRTTVWLDIPRSGGVTLAVHDLRGRLVRTLWAGPMDAGRCPVTWDGMDERGQQAASGVYLVRLVTAGGDQQAVKVTLTK